MRLYIYLWRWRMQNWHFGVLEKVSEGLWPVFKGFVKCVMVIQFPVIQQNCGRVQKTKKDIRGLLCREKLENGKKSTVRDFENAPFWV